MTSVIEERVALFESRIDGTRWQEHVKSDAEAFLIAVENRARVVRTFSREVVNGNR